MSDTSRVLDQIANVYCEDVGFERVLMKYKISEVDRFVAGTSLLDVGCGVGVLTRALSPRFERVVGIDGSPAKIEKARAHNPAPNVTYVHTLFQDYAPTERFSCIVSTNVLEHVDDASAFLRLLCGWLEPGGRIIMTVPNALGLHKRIGRAMGLIDDFYKLTEADHQKGHVRIYDRDLLRRAFEDAGLTVAHLGGILLKPLSHRQMEAWEDRVVDALFEVGRDFPELCSSLLVVGQR